MELAALTGPGTRNVGPGTRDLGIPVWVPPSLYRGIRKYCEIHLSPGSNGEDCADLSTSMKFGTDVEQNILNSFFEGAEAGTQWGHHICQIQGGRLPLF